MHSNCYTFMSPYPRLHLQELCELVVGSQSDEQCCLVLTLLADAIASLSDAALLAEYPQLCSTLRWGLGRGGGAPTTRAVCTATTQLVTRVHSSHNVVKNFSSHHLPFLLAPLLSLAQTGPTLQPPALAALSHCLVLFQSTTLQHKVHMCVANVHGALNMLLLTPAFFPYAVEVNIVIFVVQLYLRPKAISHF